MQRNYTATLVLFLLAIVVTATACQQQKAPPLTQTELDEITRGQPEIFVEINGALTLEGIEDLYLGQPYDEALAVLNDYCSTLETFEGGWRHNDAVFKGCIIEEGGHITTLRAGFWPQNENRVSTLEIKDRRLSQPLIRARFTQVAGELTQDLPRRGILMMTSPEYRLFASWDDGQNAPVHIIIGFQP